MAREPELRPEAMTPDQRECYDLLIALVHGAHHLNGPVRSCGRGIRTSLLANFATADGDMLTRLVILAHDRCIRAEINPGGPYRLSIALHKRNGREGPMHARHATMEQAIACARNGRLSA